MATAPDLTHRKSPSRTARRALGLLALIAAAWALPAWAGTERQAVIVLRALGYDYNLKSHVTGETLGIGVVYKEGDAASAAMADAWLKGFQTLGSVKVSGLTIAPVKVAYTNAAALKTAAAGKNLQVLFVCEGLDGELGAIKDLAHAQKLLTVAGKEAYVTSGLTLGVFANGEQNSIQVNLTAASAEDASFSSDLLKLSKVIR